MVRTGHAGLRRGPKWLRLAFAASKSVCAKAGREGEGRAAAQHTLDRHLLPGGEVYSTWVRGDGFCI